MFTWTHFALVVFLVTVAIALPLMLFEESRRCIGKVFVRIEKLLKYRYDALGGSKSLKSGFAEMKKDIAEMKKDIVEIKKDIVEMKVSIAGIKATIASIKETIAEMKATIASILKRVGRLESAVFPAVKANSPMVLRGSGKKASIDLKIPDLAEKHLTELLKIIGDNKTEYNIQQTCLHFCENDLWDLLDHKAKQAFEKVAFQRGWELKVLFKVAGVVFRDRVFKELGISIDNSKT